MLTFEYETEPRVTADIVICMPVVREEAKAQDKTQRDHLAHLVVHGVLHAQGYDHEHDEEADEMEQFYRHLEQTLIQIGFLIPERPCHLMPRLRRLYGRAEVNRLEMNILRGILTETQKAARGEPHKRRDHDV